MYYTLDYLPDLTVSEMAAASRLIFKPESVPSIGWDNKANVYGYDSYALLHGVYQFTAIEGATYDVFSTSYFDPYLLRIYDQFGNTIVSNDESDDGWDIFLGDAYYGQDVVFDWVAPYTGTYYVNASWNQGSYYKYYSLSIYEDIDTSTVDRYPPTVMVESDKAILGIGGVATISFALSEPSNDFTAADIEVTGGTLSGFTGDGTNYKALFTPEKNSTVAATIKVGSGKFSDYAGNFNNDGIDENNNVTINVNTIYPAPSNRIEKNKLDILVDRNVLGAGPLLLKGLDESINYKDGLVLEHTITYNSIDFDYAKIDRLITTVVRNGDFTQEFMSELTDFMPSAAGLKYADAVLLVGVANIDSAIIAVCGADENYVA